MIILMDFLGRNVWMGLVVMKRMLRRLYLGLTHGSLQARAFGLVPCALVLVVSLARTKEEERPKMDFQKRKDAMKGALLLACTAIALSAGPSTTAQAQSLSPMKFNAGAPDVKPAAPYQLDAWIAVDPKANRGILVVRAIMNRDGYLHALTQDGPARTRLEVAVHEGFEIDGIFRPSVEPKVIENDPVLNERIEKHYESVDFFLPIKIAANQNPEDLKIKVRVNGQVCIDNSSCIPVRDKILVAEFGTYLMASDEATYHKASEPSSKERLAELPGREIR
jgi:hypothetical protein